MGKDVSKAFSLDADAKFDLSTSVGGKLAGLYINR